MIKRVMKSLLLLSLLAAGLGCSERDDRSKNSAAAGSIMKCGAGKCGANMPEGNSALAKKRMNILSQMREEDSRRDCVTKAQNTKALYDCVRDPETGRLSTKCGVMNDGKPMRCGAGKCSGG
ncbi:hypothetical protein [Sulfurimonas sp. HSL3-7]|uniref:HvfA family oxazolone/thioamide-modified RiPP metallophore n=1 Tax=Sulfonitrofixus jiaomeiensis TaxID=3131938 RepID=UPI0031F9BFE6